MYQPRGFKSLGIAFGITILLGLFIDSATSAVSSVVKIKPEMGSILTLTKFQRPFRIKS